ncbi:MAG: hypothetical protein SCARUB_01681 [Candidatus Scalindua rubra]|uniref:Uncharacterized protein n=1 Tax=Candidatus Scalindua rubra TaxID=1872076 RepID=A0A1E3XC74_9BACT|nr:MAG: hypothetical protein SCARUB_01681 [Candidatus Scalindua rubra]
MDIQAIIILVAMVKLLMVKIGKMIEKKDDERMWAFFKGVLDEWLGIMYEATTEYMAGLEPAAKKQFTEALKIFHGVKRHDTEKKLDQILEILTKKQENN